MGAKLDFVREDVPNVRSLTFLSFICPTPLSLRYPANHPLRLHSFASPSSLWTAAFILCQVSPALPSSFALRFRFPRRRSTTSRRFPTFRGTMHISPIFMEFLVDFLPPSLPSFSISITNVFHSVSPSFTLYFLTSAFTSFISLLVCFSPTTSLVIILFLKCSNAMYLTYVAILSKVSWDQRNFE